jgi:hypothetical protein
VPVQVADRFGVPLASRYWREDGDPAKAARALDLALQADNPPLRLQVGTDSIVAVRAHAEQLLRDLAAWQQVGSYVRIDPNAPDVTWQSRLDLAPSIHPGDRRLSICCDVLLR